MERIESLPAIEALVQVAYHHPEQDEVIVVDNAVAHKEMKPVIDREKRKARNASD
jgi:hypothetical protein